MAWSSGVSRIGAVEAAGLRAEIVEGLQCAGWTHDEDRARVIDIVAARISGAIKVSVAGEHQTGGRVRTIPSSEFV